MRLDAQRRVLVVGDAEANAARVLERAACRPSPRRCAARRSRRPARRGDRSAPSRGRRRSCRRRRRRRRGAPCRRPRGARRSARCASSVIFDATNVQLSLRGCTNRSSGTPRACANVGGTGAPRDLDGAPRVERLRIAERGGALLRLRARRARRGRRRCRGTDRAPTTSVTMPASRARLLDAGGGAFVRLRARARAPRPRRGPRRSPSRRRRSRRARARPCRSSRDRTMRRDHGEGRDDVGLRGLRRRGRAASASRRARRGLGGEATRCIGRWSPPPLAVVVVSPRAGPAPKKPRPRHAESDHKRRRLPSPRRSAPDSSLVRVVIGPGTVLGFPGT